MEKKLKTSLQTATAFLEKKGLRYAVIGGIAMAQWGVVRVTRDVDIKVLVPDRKYDAIRSLLTKNFPDKTRLNIPENPLILSIIIDGVINDKIL
jgi:hypothetical protein